MKIIEGNLLDQRPGVLCHQVNLRGVMGAGIALQIRQKWDSVHDDYIRLCRKSPYIGLVQFCRIDHDLFVANLFGQADTGSLISGCRTVYYVYPVMLADVRRFSTENNLPIYFPYGIGCGIAGGNWEQMYNILETNLPEATLVRYTSVDAQKEAA